MNVLQTSLFRSVQKTIPSCSPSGVIEDEREREVYRGETQVPDQPKVSRSPVARALLSHASASQPAPPSARTRSSQYQSIRSNIVAAAQTRHGSVCDTVSSDTWCMPFSTSCPAATKDLSGRVAQPVVMRPTRPCGGPPTRHISLACQTAEWAGALLGEK